MSKLKEEKEEKLNVQRSNFYWSNKTYCSDRQLPTSKPREDGRMSNVKQWLWPQKKKKKKSSVEDTAASETVRERAHFKCKHTTTKQENL